ncbi:hypothetical protein LshimejAT787_0212200 [Lyophyllum shimeji]|uniref:Uncharacterized protein n=1 Tax=Lyophyllum shimeji TaxID=47721 RepID=A0A9P3PGJ7_LYOSH|nr:hypothetical protein LshimejAT787_0212200 [Lyophyllum shimeji]
MYSTQAASGSRPLIPPASAGLRTSPAGLRAHPAGLLVPPPSDPGFAAHRCATSAAHYYTVFTRQGLLRLVLFGSPLASFVRIEISVTNISDSIQAINSTISRLCAPCSDPSASAMTSKRPREAVEPYQDVSRNTRPRMDAIPTITVPPMPALVIPPPATPQPSMPHATAPAHFQPPPPPDAAPAPVAPSAPPPPLLSMISRRKRFSAL